MSFEDAEGPGGARSAPADRVRPRHDGFTGEKRERFLAEVARSGCIRDGCRAAGISKTTVERWRTRDAEFAAALALKLDLAAVSLERLAFERAVQGGEEVTIRGGEIVSIRRKPSDAMLRMLLQGASPEKYGRTAGERQASAAMRRRLKDELRAEIAAEANKHARPITEVRADILARMDRIEAAHRDEQLVAGYRPVPADYPGEDGPVLIAPGWAIVRDPDG